MVTHTRYRYLAAAQQFVVLGGHVDFTGCLWGCS
jgi:hypothetical protein